MAYAVALLAVAGLVALRELVRWGVMHATKQYVLAVIAGLAATYLGVAGLAFAYHAIHGQIVGHEVVVGDVLEGYDARDKLAPGDVVVAVDGVALGSDALTELVNAREGQPVKLTITRDGASREVAIQPARNPDAASSVHWLLGIRKESRPVRVTDAGAAARAAATFPVEGVRMLVGELTDRGASASDDPGGPKRIVDEHTVTPSFGDVAWRLTLRFALVAMMLLVVLDAVRFVRRARAATR